MRGASRLATALVALGCVGVGSSSCGSSGGGEDNPPFSENESGADAGGIDSVDAGAGLDAALDADAADVETSDAGGGVDGIMDAEPGADAGPGGGPDAPGDQEGYSSLPPPRADRRHGIALASGASTAIPLSWHEASGQAPPADFWVEANGRPVLQVSSLGGRPFVRAGLDVAPIQAGVMYRLVLTREGASMTAALVHDLSRDGEVVLRTEVPVADTRLADNAPVADVVLPATFWRSSVVTALP